ncbi:MAG: 3-methyl-2-oxobutanoate hydroxymethyltransferase, partial [Acidithiobacillus sp.]|nr:3-methyl-2-oxobutanoate hydroxymethyltransferase [Acidithiobacillus sp.]
MHKKISRWVKDKQQGVKRALVTAYDYPTARFAAAAGMHGVLVGDSLGMVVCGDHDTLNVTLEQMCYHTRMVRRGAGGCLVFADLPFGTYEKSPEQAWESAG